MIAGGHGLGQDYEGDKAAKTDIGGKISKYRVGRYFVHCANEVWT